MEGFPVVFAQADRPDLDAAGPPCRTDDHRGNSRPAPAVVPGPLGPHHVEGRGQGVGHRRGRGQHGGREDSLGRLPGAGIEDVPQAPSPVPEELHAGLHILIVGLLFEAAMTPPEDLDAKIAQMKLRLGDLVEKGW